MDDATAVHGCRRLGDASIQNLQLQNLPDTFKREIKDAFVREREYRVMVTDNKK